MKKLIAALALIVALAPRAHAQQKTDSVAVRTVVSYDTICSTTSIAAAAPIEVSSNNATSPLNGAMTYTLTVQNLSTSADVWCSQDSGITSTLGYMIARATGATAQPNEKTWIIPIWRKWFCISSSGAVAVTVCKSR